MDNLYDLFSNGLKESIVDPLTEDWKNAYWMQRAARERYPVADAALNFIPTPVGAGIGLATNLDDLYHDTRDFNILGAAQDLAGTAFGYSRAKGAVSEGVSMLKDIAKIAPKQSGKAALILGSIPVGYGASVMAKQANADKQYGDTRIQDIANKLRWK